MKNILVVDDSPTIRISVQYALKGTSCAVIQAENGAKGIDEVNKLKSEGRSLALCIVDFNMPVMDGLTFVQEFRKVDKFTPVLFLTTESDESKIKSAKDAGASGWIIKPFKPESFLKVVSKFIG